MDTPAMATAYEDVKRLITQIANAFRQRHGGDWEEMLAESNLLFVEACKCHDPEKSKLSTWVRNRVWYGLLDRHKREANLRRNLEREPERRGFAGLDIGRLLREVSQDARVVLDLVVTPPPLLEIYCEDRDFYKRAWAFRKVLTERLGRLGWCALRIAETFNEIREVL